MRNAAERRHNDWREAIRKRNIVHHIYRWNEDWYNNLHQYSKNKIHCSCPMCSAKTNNKHRSGARGWEPPKNWSIRDQKRILEMEEELEEE